MKLYKKISLIVFLALIAVFGNFALTSVSAQIPPECNSPQSQKEKEFCSELKALEEEKAELQKILNVTRQQSNSLSGDIQILEAKIQEAQNSIRAKNLAIDRLSDDIGEKTETIYVLEERIDKGKQSLAQLIRKKNEIDSFSLVEVMLSNEDLSDFFSDLNSYDSIKDSLQILFEEIRNTKSLTEKEKESLQVKVVQETDIKAAIEAEKARVERDEQEKQYLLEINKNQEKTYEEIIKEREQRAAQIRSALFALRDTGAIPFGQALDHANVVFQQTGVRPAFLLSIITQESNLGKNVGTCNRPGDALTWKDIMPGPNDNSWRDDQTIFVQLMEELGRSPDGTPLSCPWGNGWGGAMGPSQFIPTTWNSYKSKIASALGVGVPDPWQPLHAFMASGLYLADLGAAGGGYTAERTAALKYYAGSNWNNPSNAFYGDQVMARVAQLQADIDLLQGI